MILHSPLKQTNKVNGNVQAPSKDGKFISEKQKKDNFIFGQKKEDFIWLKTKTN